MYAPKRGVKSTSSELEFKYGETSCEAKLKSGSACNDNPTGLSRTYTTRKCKNKAYFYDNGYLCGVHCKNKDKKLPKVSGSQLKAQKDTEDTDLWLSAERGARANKESNSVPKIGSTKMHMMKKVEHVDGYLTIFPNNTAVRCKCTRTGVACKHGYRTDGLGLSSLSPMQLGPVKHGQPDLPDAKLLENFWQGSKKYKDESMEEFRERQKKSFLDPVPHRHNERRKGHIPEGWVWTNSDGTVTMYSYLESRKFYCKYYEQLALKCSHWVVLKRQLEEEKYNLLIAGYDGVNNADVDKEGILKLYADESRPFGHELVLIAMLLCVRPWSN